MDSKIVDSNIVKGWKAHGFECCIKEISWGPPPMRNWYCGYVLIPEDHPDFGRSYDSMEIEVHGGITFAYKGLFGFDCAHPGDTQDEWTLERVTQEVESMAAQFRARQNR